jgi:hypothetical protein
VAQSNGLTVQSNGLIVQLVEHVNYRWALQLFFFTLRLAPALLALPVAMNVVQEINRINERELKEGLTGSASWHHKYR